MAEKKLVSLMLLGEAKMVEVIGEMTVLGLFRINFGDIYNYDEFCFMVGSALIDPTAKLTKDSAVTAIVAERRSDFVVVQ